MQIPLTEFEQHIDETILNRGLNYFTQGAVIDCDQVSKGEYLCTVEGTNNYEVYTKIESEIITEQRCNCPYDMGPVCKHMAAVLFYLQQEDFKSDIPLRPKRKKKAAKSLYQQMKALIKEISNEELITFVLKEAKRDQKLKNAFITEFGHLMEDQSKTTYQKQIRSILKAAAGRDGFIFRSEMRYVVNQIQPMIVKAQKSFNEGKFEKVYLFSSALLEEVNEAFQYGDDSDGDLGYLVNMALEFLFHLSEAELSESLRSQFFSYCTSAFKKEIFEGWDWHLDMLALATNLANAKKEADTIRQHLSTVNEEFSKERAQEMTLVLLKRFGTEKEVAEYSAKHVFNPKIRNALIREAFKEENYHNVIELARDGIEYDKKERPGLVTTWHNWLLKVAQAQNDKPQIVKYARLLFLNNFHPEQDYFLVLKNTVPPDEWGSFLEELITELKENPHWENVQLLRGIYIKEKMWEQLLEMVRAYNSMDFTHENEQYLAEDFSEELVDIYRQGIIDFLEMYTGRKYYKRACRFIRRMKKLDGRSKAEELEEYLRQTYPKRMALMDELNQL